MLSELMQYSCADRAQLNDWRHKVAESRKEFSDRNERRQDAILRLMGYFHIPEPCFLVEQVDWDGVCDLQPVKGVTELDGKRSDGIHYHANEMCRWDEVYQKEEREKNGGKNLT
ncbi:uncharacterized protein RBU57_012515 [Macrochelys suwanniensis]